MNNKPDTEYNASPYRWVILFVFMLTNLTIQTLWISYAPIAGVAAAFYGVSDLQIGLLAMSFMIAFVPLSIPASWCIDNWGFRKAVGLGALMMGLFGILRGLAGESYALVLFATFGLAAAQPFLLNSWTTVAAKWFQPSQRATAVGLVTLGNLIGTALGMVLPPMFLEAGISIPTFQLVFGIAGAVSALLFVVLSREEPKTPVAPVTEREKALVLDGLKAAFKSPAFRYTLAVSFIGLGIFNGITTWVEGIIRPRGFGPGLAGTLGAVMIAGGLLGAVILPALSDRTGKRQPYLYIGLAGTIPGIVGLALATGPVLLLISAFVLGFFLVSALPIAMQYAAEVTWPVPEGTSNGLIQLFGQGAVVFVYLMGAMRRADGSFTISLFVASGLLCLGVFFVSRMKDKASD